MFRFLLVPLICVGAHAAADAVVVDRIAVVAGDRAIKDSDINRELRVVSFLNREQPDFGVAGRKRAASRLIDQAIIRQDIELARYEEPDPKEVDQFLAQVRGRYGNEAQYRRALERAGITEAQLRRAVAWQLTVLGYVEQRFRPATTVTDDEIRKYYEQHRAEFGTQTLAQARQKIVSVLRGDEVNKEFYAWLERRRADLRIRYLEEELR